MDKRGALRAQHTTGFPKDKSIEPPTLCSADPLLPTLSTNAIDVLWRCCGRVLRSHPRKCIIRGGCARDFSSRANQSAAKSSVDVYPYLPYSFLGVLIVLLAGLLLLRFIH